MYGTNYTPQPEHRHDEPQTAGGPPAASGITAPDSIPAERAGFIRKTYAHLAGAIGAFTVLEILFFQMGLPEKMFAGLLEVPFSWLLVMGGFIGISWLATHFASAGASRELQYAGLAIYVVAESVIFMPLLLMATWYGGAEVIGGAALMTLMLVTGLTVSVFATGADFSWLGPILCIGGFIALGACVAGVVIGFNLGLLFSTVMIVFAAGAILYDTSNILHHYRPGQHVAAALALFSSVALLFWYVIRMIMRLREELG